MTTSGAYKIEKFYLDNCRNEREFNEKIKSMSLTDIREIVFSFINREENLSFLKKRP
jgi:hypothetical protein